MQHILKKYSVIIILSVLLLISTFFVGRYSAPEKIKIDERVITEVDTVRVYTQSDPIRITKRVPQYITVHDTIIKNVYIPKATLKQTVIDTCFDSPGCIEVDSYPELRLVDLRFSPTFEEYIIEKQIEYRYLPRKETHWYNSGWLKFGTGIAIGLISHHNFGD